MSAPARRDRISGVRPISEPSAFGMAKTAPAPCQFEERHYSVAEIGELWSLSTDVVRKLFEREPGVIVIGDLAPRGKRRYTTLRVAQSIVERVHRRLRNP